MPPVVDHPFRPLFLDAPLLPAPDLPRPEMLGLLERAVVGPLEPVAAGDPDRQRTPEVRPSLVRAELVPVGHRICFDQAPRPVMNVG